MDFLKLLIPASSACLCNALANMLWKFKFNADPISINKISDIIVLMFNLKIITGVLLYVISMTLFFYMLSNFKLSIIMPVTCLTYIFNIIIAYFVFHETLSINQILGTIVIIIGLIIISQTKAII